MFGLIELIGIVGSVLTIFSFIRDKCSVGVKVNGKNYTNLEVW